MLGHPEGSLDLEESVIGADHEVGLSGVALVPPMPTKANTRAWLRRSGRRCPARAGNAAALVLASTSSKSRHPIDSLPDGSYASIRQKSTSTLRNHLPLIGCYERSQRQTVELVVFDRDGRPLLFPLGRTVTVCSCQQGERDIIHDGSVRKGMTGKGSIGRAVPVSAPRVLLYLRPHHGS